MINFLYNFVSNPFVFGFLTFFFAQKVFDGPAYFVLIKIAVYMLYVVSIFRVVYYDLKKESEKKSEKKDEEEGNDDLF